MNGKIYKEMGVRPGKLIAGVLSGFLFLVILTGSIGCYFFFLRTEPLFTVKNDSDGIEITVSERGQPLLRKNITLILTCREAGEKEIIKSVNLRIQGKMPSPGQFGIPEKSADGVKVDITDAEGEVISVYFE